MDFLSNFSTLSLSLLALIALMTVYFAGPGYNSYSAGHSPTILTSTGIFATFLGVALGLLDFDTRDIQASVPSLIDGLKTAFWTSIAGLLGALVIKFRHLGAVLQQRQVDEQYRAASITDLANILGDIRNSLNEDDAGGLKATVTGLQVAQERQLSGLGASLEQYQTRMTEANTNALVGALELVMRDFNAQINTQYGDNFKELNAAVGQMLQWQETYKTDLAELLESQRSTGRLLDKAGGAYEKIVAHSEIFNTVSNSLGTMLDALKDQSEGLDTYLTQLALVAQKASEGLPSLEGRIDVLTTNLAKSMTESQRQVSEVLTSSAQSMKQTSEQIHRTMAETLDSSQRGLHDSFEQMLTRTEQQVMRLDDAMEEELTKALKTFGYQLTSLSEKFVNDYTPLTERLQDVVRLAEKTDVIKSDCINKPGDNERKIGQRARISAQ